MDIEGRRDGGDCILGALIPQVSTGSKYYSTESFGLGTGGCLAQSFGEHLFDKAAPCRKLPARAELPLLDVAQKIVHVSQHVSVNGDRNCDFLCHDERTYDNIT